MAAKPIGAIVSITYDSDTPVLAGDWLCTPTGRAYHVIAVRLSRRSATRHYLRAIVHEDVEEVGARVHELHWYRRERSRAQ